MTVSLSDVGERPIASAWSLDSAKFDDDRLDPPVRGHNLYLDFSFSILVSAMLLALV
jgi:hypothetical protein